MIRQTLFTLLTTLLFLSPAYGARSAVQLYTGHITILATSGKSCEGLTGTHDLSLTITEAESGGGGVHGYFVGSGITIGQFSGSDPAHLDVHYPFQDEFRSSGHYLSLTRSDSALIAELHDRHIDAAADECNFDLARLELTRSVDGDAAGRMMRMTGQFDAQLTHSHAVALVQSAGYEAALPYFEKALVLADTYFEKGSDQINSYIIGLATSYTWLKRFDDFDRLFDTRIMPLQDEALRSIFGPYRVGRLLAAGQMALRREEYDSALRSFEQAYKLQPQNMEAMAAVMSVQIHRGNYTEALSFLEQAEATLENEMARREIRSVIAMVLFKKAQKDDKDGKGTEAETALKRAVILDPGSVHYLVALARLRHKAGNLAEAEKMLDQGLEQFKDAQSQNEIIAARDKIRQTELFLKKIRKAGS